MKKIKAKAHEEWIRNRVSVLLYIEDANGDMEASVPLTDLEFNPIEPGAILNPTLLLPRSTLQSLVDSLYEEMKMVPSQIKDQVQQLDDVLKATKYHLEDMRTLVFERKGGD